MTLKGEFMKKNMQPIMFRFKIILIFLHTKYNRNGFDLVCVWHIDINTWADNRGYIKTFSATIR